MIGNRAHASRPGQVTTPLAAEAEGYLLLRSHHDKARREAEQLCARMPWLTTVQAEALTHHYLNQRVELTRHMLQDTVRRADQLRQEYESCYGELRRALLRRHAAFASTVLTCATGLAAAAEVLAR
ncbi:hypothetical protein ACIRP7_21610 [Streptomyces sp. NPDC102270]|uniref:hypothetical protein n=1 Tax=Streptomyces sp. NPDC102270 TaxID=3366150 RepID=UPI00380254DF